MYNARSTSLLKWKVFERAARRQADRHRTPQKCLSKLILNSYLSKGPRTASFERCRNQDIWNSDFALKMGVF